MGGRGAERTPGLLCACLSLASSLPVPGPERVSEAVFRGDSEAGFPGSQVFSRCWGVLETVLVIRGSVPEHEVWGYRGVAFSTDSLPPPIPGVLAGYGILATLH